MKKSTVISRREVLLWSPLPLIYTLEHMNVYTFFSDSIVSEHIALVKSLKAGGSFQNSFCDLSFKANVLSSCESKCFKTKFLQIQVMSERFREWHTVVIWPVHKYLWLYNAKQFMCTFHEVIGHRPLIYYQIPSSWTVPHNINLLNE